MSGAGRASSTQRLHRPAHSHSGCGDGTARYGFWAAGLVVGLVAGLCARLCAGLFAGLFAGAVIFSVIPPFALITSPFFSIAAQSLSIGDSCIAPYFSSIIAPFFSQFFRAVISSCFAMASVDFMAS